jgi:hypothetical protein
VEESGRDEHMAARRIHEIVFVHDLLCNDDEFRRGRSTLAVRHGDNLVVLGDELDATGIYIDRPTPKITTAPLFDAISV